MKTYEKIFKLNSEESLIKAVRDGMNVYLKICHDNLDDITFFEAAVRYGTPALVSACIDMGADVNCVSPMRARHYQLRAETSSLCAAIDANNTGTLRSLLERGAKLGVLNNVMWDTLINFIPEAAYDKEAEKIKRRLDAGAEILKVLREFGFKVPGVDEGREDAEKMSLYEVYPARVSRFYHSGGKDECEKMERAAGETYTVWDNWDGEYADGYIGSARKADPYCEAPDHEYPNPYHGTRPGALWRAASPEALTLMLAGGADVNTRDAAGWTALHHIAYHAASRRDAGCYFNPTAMMQILLDSGADIEARGANGLTPLMLAAFNYDSRSWDVSAFNFLLRNDADFLAEDEQGRGVWYWMTYYWCGEDAELDEFIRQRILLKLCRSAGNEGAGRFTLMANKWDRLGEAVKFLIANGANPTLARLEEEELQEAELEEDALQESENESCYSDRDIYVTHPPIRASNQKSSKKRGKAAVKGEAAAKEQAAVDAVRSAKSAEAVKLLIDAGLNVNARDDRGYTPLMVVASKSVICPCALKAAKYLVEAGADLRLKDAKGLSVYHWLSSRWMHLFWEDQLRRELMKIIAEAFAPENDATAQKKAEAELITASSWGSAQEIQSALSLGADVNARIGYGYTPLMYAAAFNVKDAVLCLIANGAKVDAKTGGDEKRSMWWIADGTTALMLASRRGGHLRRPFPDVVRALIEAGADVNARDANRNTALILAAAAETSEVTDILLKAGAKVDTKNNDGATALKKAVEHYNFRAAKTLLTAGADPENVFAFRPKRTENEPSDGGSPQNKDEDEKSDPENQKTKACLRQFGLEA